MNLSSYHIRVIICTEIHWGWFHATMQLFVSFCHSVLLIVFFVSPLPIYSPLFHYAATASHRICYASIWSELRKDFAIFLSIKDNEGSFNFRSICSSWLGGIEAWLVGLFVGKPYQFTFTEALPSYIIFSKRLWASFQLRLYPLIKRSPFSVLTDAFGGTRGTL